MTEEKSSEYIKILYIKNNVVEEVLYEPIETPNVYVVKIKNGSCSLDIYKNKNIKEKSITEEQKTWHKTFINLHFMLYFCILFYIFVCYLF